MSDLKGERNKRYDEKWKEGVQNTQVGSSCMPTSSNSYYDI